MPSYKPVLTERSLVRYPCMQRQADSLIRIPNKSITKNLNSTPNKNLILVMNSSHEIWTPPQSEASVKLIGLDPNLIEKELFVKAGLPLGSLIKDSKD